MNEVLAAWNARKPEDAEGEVLSCCGSRAWATALASGRPYAGGAELLAAADALWWALDTEDWLEAFQCHPRIGEGAAAAHVSGAFDQWSRQEQAQAQTAGEATRQAIAEGNRLYEQQFGLTYIVYATGKSADEMLAILKGRLQSDRESELKEAAEQQRQITQLRLNKWLAG